MLTMIDQISAIAAPLASGFILEWVGLRTGCIVFVVWNVLAWSGMVNCAVPAEFCLFTTR